MTARRTKSLNRRVRFAPASWDRASTRSEPLAGTSGMLQLPTKLSESEKSKLAAMEELSAEEQRKIAKVLERDVNIQKHEQQRLMMAKLAVTVYDNELKDQNRRRQLKASNTSHLFERRCCVCSCALGYVNHLGFECVDCKQRACRKCSRKAGDKQKICSTCEMHRDYKAKSGAWFYSKDDSNVHAELQIKTPSAVFLSELRQIHGRRSEPELNLTKTSSKRNGNRRGSTMMSAVTKLKGLHLMSRSHSRDGGMKASTERAGRRQTEAGICLSPQLSKLVERERKHNERRRSSTPNLQLTGNKSGKMFKLL